MTERTAPLLDWTFPAMGTTWRIHHGGGVDGDDAQAVADLVAADERRWSRFLPQSDVGRVTRGAGRPVEVAGETLDLVEAAIAWSVRTDGAFQPLVAAQLGAWGYRARLGDGGERPPADAPVVAAALIALDHPARTIAIPPGTGLDLGGIGKSWSATRAAALLAARVDDERLILDAGGDLAIVRGSHVCATEAGDVRAHAGQGVATSSSERRRWTLPDGSAGHHLIDPDSGRPGERGTAVVVGADPVAADVLATCLVLRPVLLDELAEPAARRSPAGACRANAAWRTVAVA